MKLTQDGPIASNFYSNQPLVPKPGTHRTRLNAYKHGLTGQLRLLSAEEQKAFEAHCAGILESLAPVGHLESVLAQSIAENHWRLKRVCEIETNIFALGHQGELGHRTPSREDAAQIPIDEAMSQARTWLAKSGNFQLLALYEQRINRTIERHMAELCTLRAERKAALDQALAEAQLFVQLAESKGETYHLAHDFPPELLLANSVFSPAAIARFQRLTEARNLAKNPKKPGMGMPTAA